MYPTNDPRNKGYRREMRVQPTKAEKKLWFYLRSKKLGVKFRRQFGIANFIVDFYCHELKLIVEVDGWVHGEDAQKYYDRERGDWLRARGYTIVRYSNDHVLKNTEGVYYHLSGVIEKLQQ